MEPSRAGGAGGAGDLSYETDQDPDRPDICIGSDDFHTPPALTSLAMMLCREAGWTVAVNRPFAGALVPMSHYRKDARVHSVMIEVNRGLYLDELTGARGAAFEHCRAVLERVLHRLIETARTMDGQKELGRDSCWTQTTCKEFDRRLSSLSLGD